MTTEDGLKKDFFISYTRSDQYSGITTYLMEPLIDNDCQLAAAFPNVHPVAAKKG